MFQRCKYQAFSLAELLIALLILGQIATFTIPKLLHSQANAQRKAVLLETFATINQAVYLARHRKSEGQSAKDYFAETINSVIICNNAASEGCYPGGSDWSADSPGIPGFVLHNGAMIWDLDSGSSGCDPIIIDWNGSKGLNIQGDDQMVVRYNFGDGSCTNPRPGTVAHSSNGNAASEELFNEIFQ